MNYQDHINILHGNLCNNHGHYNFSENLEECISYKQNYYIQAENTGLLVVTNNLLVSENCLSAYKK